MNTEWSKKTCWDYLISFGSLVGPKTKIHPRETQTQVLYPWCQPFVVFLRTSQRRKKQVSSPGPLGSLLPHDLKWWGPKLDSEPQSSVNAPKVIFLGLPRFPILMQALLISNISLLPKGGPRYVKHVISTQLVVLQECLPVLLFFRA